MKSKTWEEFSIDKDLLEVGIDDIVISKSDYNTIISNARHDALSEAVRITSMFLQNNRLHPDIPNEKLSDAARIASHSALQQAALEIESLRDQDQTKCEK